MEVANKMLSVAIETYLRALLTGLNERYGVDMPVEEALTWLGSTWPSVAVPPVAVPVPAPAVAVPVAVAKNKKSREPVNKTQLVEDVIAQLMNTSAPVTVSTEVVVPAEAQPAVVETEAVPAQKKKSAPKKKAEAQPAVVSTEAVVVSTEVVPAAEAVPAPKKKSAPKKKAEAQPAEAEAVVVSTEVVPVVVSTETEAVPAPKKKSAPKKKAEAQPAVVSTETAEAPKKKSAPKKKAEAETETAVPEPKKKSAPKKKAEAQPVPAIKNEEPKKAELEPKAELELEPESEKEEDDGTEAEDFFYEGVQYARTEDNVVYDIETSEPIGRWDGEAVIFNSDSE